MSNANLAVNIADPPRGAEEPVIRVNGVEIPAQKVYAEMQYHPADSRAQALSRAAQTLIIGELLRQRARELGIRGTEEDSASDEDFIEQLIDREVSLPETTEAACRTYFAANPERFATSPLLELKHILLAVPKEDEAGRAEGRTRADALLKMLQQGADFAALARQESACPSRESGGNLGQISRGQTVPEFERQVFAAQPGLMPRPVESRYGFHLVLIERRIAGNPLPYEAVAEQIAQYLGEKVRRRAVAQYIEVLISRADIQGYDFNRLETRLIL